MRLPVGCDFEFNGTEILLIGVILSLEAEFQVPSRLIKPKRRPDEDAICFNGYSLKLGNLISGGIGQFRRGKFPDLALLGR